MRSGLAGGRAGTRQSRVIRVVRYLPHVRLRPMRPKNEHSENVAKCQERILPEADPQIIVRGHHATEQSDGGDG